MSNVLTRKLELFGELSEADKDLLDAVASRSQRECSRVDLISEGSRPDHIFLVLRGLCYQNNVLADGRRSIFSYLVPGDICDPNILLLRNIDYNVSTSTSCTVAEISRQDVSAMMKQPAIARALKMNSMVESATFRHWLINVTRRGAESSVAHLLLEMYFRLASVGIVKSNEFDLPATQAELSDMLGLSPVHINRLLGGLRAKGFVEFKRGQVKIPDAAQLAAVCNFNPSYLQMPICNPDV